MMAQRQTAKSSTDGLERLAGAIDELQTVKQEAEEPEAKRAKKHLRCTMCERSSADRLGFFDSKTSTPEKCKQVTH